uniref:ZmpA/ZmpB/ZmpC family metallo-endopeptidase-related protein n=1 Tax=Endozoicomonas sp. ONNA2 TaxID=2828741 RepID=UPI00214862C7
APDSWIKVNNTDDLNKICLDGTSCSGKYQLTKDINGNQLARSIGNKNHGFNGHLDGDDFTIYDLSSCLVKNLTGNGRITNLNFFKAYITSEEPTGVAACEMSGDAIIGNIRVENAYIETRGAHAAIGAGSVSDRGTIINTRAVNCRVDTSGANSHAGIGVGYLSGGKVTNTRAINCRVEAKGKKAKAGIGAGMSKGGVVTDTNATNCTVKTARKLADAGIGVGSQADGGIVTRTYADHCNVTTLQDYADAGIGAGESQQSTVSQTTAVKCNLITFREESDAGVGVGYQIGGTVTRTTANHCRVVTKYHSANAGIGVGSSPEGGAVSHTKAVNCEVYTNLYGATGGIGAGATRDVTVSHTTAVNCNVTTHGIEAAAGIGTGLAIGGDVSYTTAVNCNLKTHEEAADAGIGAGDNSGHVTDTTAKNCTIKTSGIEAYAGIGAGANDDKEGIINNTIAVDCDVSTEGEYATAGIGAGEPKGNITNTRAIDSNVTSRHATADISGGKNPVICNVNVNRKRISSARGCQSWWDNNFCADIDRSLLTPKCKIINNGLDNLANSRPTSPIPETVVTQIPFAASLDASTKIVIALGSVIVVLLGAISVIACRYCRSSTNANRNREQPMPEGSQPRTRGQRPALPRHQTSENRRPRPGLPPEHYQPLLFNLISLPPVPRSPYQGLVYQQANMATDDGTPVEDSEQEPALHPSDSPVYQELSEYEYTDSQGESDGPCSNSWPPACDRHGQ